MQIKTSMLEVYFVTDEYGEIIAGPFLFEAEAAEWMEENNHD